jgi:hypothetical protein
MDTVSPFLFRQKALSSLDSTSGGALVRPAAQWSAKSPFRNRVAVKAMPEASEDDVKAQLIAEILAGVFGITDEKSLFAWHSKAAKPKQAEGVPYQTPAGNWRELRNFNGKLRSVPSKAPGSDQEAAKKPKTAQPTPTPKKPAGTKPAPAPKKPKPVKIDVATATARIDEMRKNGTSEEALTTFVGELSGMTVPQLKELQGKLGVKPKGIKADLIAKVKEVISEFAVPDDIEQMPTEEETPAPEPKPEPAAAPDNTVELDDGDAINLDDGDSISLDDDEMINLDDDTPMEPLPDRESDEPNPDATDTYPSAKAMPEGVVASSPHIDLPVNPKPTFNRKDAMRLDDVNLDNPFSTQDEDALRAYTTIAYQDINAYLRDGTKPLDRRTPKVLRDLAGAMAKLPPIKPPVTVYRGLTIKGNEIDKFIGDIMKKAESGNPLKLKGYQSTSLNPEVADRFKVTYGEEGVVPVRMQVRANKGAYLEGTTVVPNEQELLLPAGNKYKVGQIVKDPDGGFTVTLEQM